MIDPLTSLAFSIHSGRGVYALLLGSGVSRAAQIPTGWEVTLDLIWKLAAVEGEDCGADPAAWYVKKFGKEPDYSDLLAGMALTPAERTNALRGYFEAGTADLEEGKKVPTAAHKAIARLVKAGYFRVIITTNFDRLLEQALIAEGVDPTVISTPDMVLGATPLAHSSCTVIKVHGDYRDTRLRNTTEELSSYDPVLDKLLDRVFDEYGLIACGWSGTWDEALRSAIQRSPNRRYSMTWAAKGRVSEEAESLIKFRGATALEIQSADAFFQSLEDKLDSLEALDAPHPLSAALAVTSLKRYLVEDRFRIQLQDMVFAELERPFPNLSSLPVSVSRLSCEALMERLALYESSMQILISLMVHGCFWGSAEQSQLWPRVVLRLLDLAPTSGGTVVLLNLRRYPALVALYAGGIASVASGKYHNFKALMRDARTSVDAPVEGKDDLLIRRLVLYNVLQDDVLNRCAEQKLKTPGSDRLHKLLREPFRALIPSDKDYDNAFDRFEYLTALVAYDANVDDNSYIMGAVGRFGWRNRAPFGTANSSVIELLLNELKMEGDDWALFRSGVFASPERYLAAVEGFNQNVLAHFRSY